MLSSTTKRLDMNELERILILAEVFIPPKNLISKDKVPMYPEESNRNILRHNFRMLLNLWRSEGSYKIFAKNIGIIGEETIDPNDGWVSYKYEMTAKKLFTIITQIPLLSQYKIEKELGSGYYGIVFQLNNGRALKISRVQDQGYSENDKFVGITYGNSEVHQMSLSTFAVFDFGKFKGEGVEGSWSEVPIIEPIQEQEHDLWDKVRETFGQMRFHDTDIFEKSIANNDADMLMQGMFSMKSPHNHRLGESFKDFAETYGIRKTLGMIKAAITRFKIDGNIRDAHTGNVGRLIQDPDTYVIFDN